MEDAVRALEMAFGVLVFVIAISCTFMMVTQARTTAEVVFYASDKTNFYDNIEKIDENESNIQKERIVGLDTVIPTLYRYWKESFSVWIYDEDGKLVQVFDNDIENETNIAESKPQSQRSAKENMLISLYGDHNTADLFEAPWRGNTDKSANDRIDYFINGSKAYINNILVDYSGNNSLAYLRSQYKNKYSGQEIQFSEKFLEYDYSGKSITSDDGEISLTDEKGNSKIEIIYKVVGP